MKAFVAVLGTLLLSIGCTSSINDTPSSGPTSGKSRASNAADATVYPVVERTAPVDTQEYLRAFYRDPKAIMNLPPAKRLQDGSLSIEPASPFDGVSKEEMAEARFQLRMQICKDSGRDCSRPKAKKKNQWTLATGDNVITEFLDEPYLNRLDDMENQGLLQAVVAQPPWSDSFWPTVKGLIARRWTDPAFPEDKTNWLANYNYFSAVPPWAATEKAPSEKYDQLVGDPGFLLTQANWARGKYHVDKGNEVPLWAGLCHGWAPASIFVPNPQRSVTLKAVDGTDITFYPSDIKALASLAWGEAKPRQLERSAGDRCDFPDPQEDAVGRVEDHRCFDINPGTWHMAVVNMLGVQKRSFIHDSTYDFQVWNFPLYAYKYDYFNPQTHEVSSELAGSAVKVSDFTIDKFKSRRSPNAKYVVGIAMDVSFVGVTGPSRAPAALKPDQIKTTKYLYDLELDAMGNIIGGEWYSNFHPDFIWGFPADAKPLSVGEKNLIQQSGSLGWDGPFPVPPHLQEAAKVSSKNQQPIAAIVEALVSLAQQPEGVPPIP